MIIDLDTITPDIHWWRGGHSFICFCECLGAAEAEFLERYLW